MLYMVIETFKPGKAGTVYERFQERGRMTPAGLEYVQGWVDSEVTRCFQLMECENMQLFEEGKAHWQDLIDFQIVPVIASKEAMEKVLG